MIIARIGAITPPEKGRSRWARDNLSSAIEKQLAPTVLPPQQIVSFTATLPPHLIDQLKSISHTSGLSLAGTAAGLIEANIALLASEGNTDEEQPAAPPPLVGAERVRPILHGLLVKANEGIEQGKIAFAEAATGTGKGRMIASLAASAAARGDSVVVSAPLAVTWQLLDDLAELEQAVTAGFDLILGRANFVSPQALAAWADDENHTDMLAWIAGGGKPLTDRARKAETLLGKPLRWLLDDALSIDSELPITSIMLTPDAGEDCEGEQVYQALRNNKGAAAIVLCSHHLLASHIRQAQMMGLTDEDEDHPALPLPLTIDTLIVDEAHLLESAFAAINSHTLHLRPLIRSVEREIRTGRTALLASLNDLAAFVSTKASEKARSNHHTLASMDGLADILKALDSAIQKAKLTKTQQAEPIKVQLEVARSGIRAALSGSMTLKCEVSPVRKYPQLIVGRASLDKVMAFLWDRVAGAALISATLYSDDNSAKLARWKLGVPPARALYLPAVHPAWVAKSVRLRDVRVAIAPDDSEAWLDELAEKVMVVADGARGGVLVLCTSHLNTQGLAQRLKDHLGNRLIAQTPGVAANRCISEFKANYHNGIMPVWIGLGAAWTGINLSDDAKPAEDDYMLTDLVIARLPLGVNRSLTHERRTSIAGFSIVAQEAAWHLRQGLGRLVRREGVPQRNLWVLDNRVDDKAPWLTPFKRILKRYHG